MSDSKSITSPTDGQPATRDRLVEAASALFSRYGYAATGVKAVLAAADAPYGSLYHWFPGGKKQLGVAVLAKGGAHNRALIEERYPANCDVVAATATSFLEAADLLEATSYADACPIATIALEVASSDEEMRTTAAEAFESWLAIFEHNFKAAGMAPERAREVAVEVFCLMEGAMMLSRTSRSVDSLNTAGRAAARAVAAGLADARKES